MHKTLTDLIVAKNVEEFLLDEGPAQPPDAERSPGVIATNGPVSILHVPYNLPEQVSFRGARGNDVNRFVAGPDTMDLYVLGEHAEGRGHGHRMYVRGFVPDTTRYTTHRNGSLARASFVTPDNMTQFVEQFAHTLEDAGLPGTLGNYIFGSTHSPSFERVPASAMSLSIKHVSVDEAIKRAVQNNPGLEPYRGSLDMVYFRNPPAPKEEKD